MDENHGFGENVRQKIKWIGAKTRPPADCATQMKYLPWNGIVIFLLLTALGCNDRVRASDGHLVGTYVTSTNTGKEELTLRSDGTYVQAFSSPRKQFTNRGTWKSSYLFLDGTQIELRRANLSEDVESDRYGDLMLQVHRENGRLKLARNESADWYYDRIQ